MLIYNILFYFGLLVNYLLINSRQ